MSRNNLPRISSDPWQVVPREIFYSLLIDFRSVCYLLCRVGCLGGGGGGMGGSQCEIRLLKAEIQCYDICVVVISKSGFKYHGLLSPLTDLAIMYVYYLEECALSNMFLS